MLNACATNEKIAGVDKSAATQSGEKAGSAIAEASASNCDAGAAERKSWQCRILDGKSYVITDQQNNTNIQKTPSQNRSGKTYKSAVPGPAFKYGDSAVKDFLQLEDDLYAVQIFANSNKEAGVAFINTKRLGRARLLHTRVNGRDWYVALLGVYADLELARKRAKAYREVHPGETPWIRSVKSLKAVYRAAII